MVTRRPLVVVNGQIQEIPVGDTLKLADDGSGTFTALVSTGNTIIGDDVNDTLTINPSSVTWATNVTHSGNHSFAGNLTVNGTTTTLNSTVLTVDDINIELGSVTSPTDTTANGGGITLKGSTDKTLSWDNTNFNWTSSEHWNLSTNKYYKINNVTVLNSTALGSSVTASSLTSLGTVTSGTWNASAVGIAFGGTGATNAASALTNLGAEPAGTALIMAIALG